MYPGQTSAGAFLTADKVSYSCNDYDTVSLSFQINHKGSTYIGEERTIGEIMQLNGFLKYKHLRIATHPKALILIQ
jgi:hypothetical protein